jgi:hypothetical protein
MKVTRATCNTVDMSSPTVAPRTHQDSRTIEWGLAISLGRLVVGVLAPTPDPVSVRSAVDLASNLGRPFRSQQFRRAVVRRLNLEQKINENATEVERGYWKTY